MLETSMEVFMDDYLVFGDLFDSFLTNLGQMLVRCKQAHLVLNWEKCHLIVTKGILLGRKVSSVGLEVDEAKFNTKLLEKDAIFNFNKECVEAFELLKEKLMNASIMVSPDWSRPFKLMRDASDFAVGAETLKLKFLNKNCPPARTAKKTEEINNFQQGPDESLFRAWERFTKLLMKFPQHYLTDLQEVRKVKILETYDHTLPQKENDTGSFTLPSFIHNVCFNKALIDLGRSVSVMPFSTYTNLSLGDLSHTRLTVELADRTIKHPRGIAGNVLVRIGKFIFLIDFIILDIPEDDDVPLILGRPFLSTARTKIDVVKRKITIRVGEEKIVFKSIKPATSII
nr:hypothetical protein [Tanacetum cinerariifolium]